MEYKTYIVADLFKTVSKRYIMIIYFGVLEKCFGDIFCYSRKMWSEIIHVKRMNFVTEPLLFSRSVFLLYN